MEQENTNKAYNAAPWNQERDIQQRLEYKSEKVMLYGENPFDVINAGDTHRLAQVMERSECGLCGKSRMYYCYTCYIPLDTTSHIIPKMVQRLPCKVDIIKHPREVDGKSTSAHAKVICPSDVRIFTCPDVPDYKSSSNVEGELVLLVYPGKDAQTLDDRLPNLNALKTKRLSVEDDTEMVIPNVRVVFVDSTWNQTARILKHPRIKNLPKVKIDDRETIFWRYQTGKSKQHLATIEAIYYFLVDYHTKVLGKCYGGEYDQLLFLYKFMYGKIHQLYDRSKLRSYNR